MTYLILKASDEVRQELPRFQQILSGYGIRVMDFWENEAAGTIEILTNAEKEADITSVRAVAYDCFEDTLMEFRSTGKYRAFIGR